MSRPTPPEHPSGPASCARFLARAAFAVLPATLVLMLLDAAFGVSGLVGETNRLFDSSLLRLAIYVGIMVWLTTAPLLLLRARRLGVALGFLGLFAMSTVVELTYAGLNNGRGFAEDQVATAFREIRFATQAMGSFVTPAVIVAGLGVLLFWALLFPLVRSRRLFGPLLPDRAVVLVVVGLALTAAAAFARFEQFTIYPTPVRPLHNVALVVAREASVLERAPVAVETVDAELVAERLVMIVDESIAASALSLNGYPVATTPYLETIAPRLINLGMAVSGSTCSHHSNMILNSFIHREDVEHASAVQQRQTIFYYAKQAGFRTVLLAGATRVATNHGIRPADLQYIDEVVLPETIAGTERWQEDGVLADALVSLFRMRPDEKMFVFVTKRGAHFHYDSTYPDDQAPFQPTLEGQPLAVDRERAMNSYQNAVRFSVDEFYRDLDQRLGETEALFLYTSDHGQDFEGGLTHCGEVPAMAQVPLWLDPRNDAVRERLARRFGTDWQAQHVDRASHFELFPTLLTLMNIATDEPTLFSPPERESRFFCPERSAYTFQCIRFPEEQLQSVAAMSPAGLPN